jgi:hypothetical protein
MNWFVNLFDWLKSFNSRLEFIMAVKKLTQQTCAGNEE